MKRNNIWIFAALLAVLVMGCSNESDAPVAVESVYISTSTLTLGVGDTASLWVDVMPWNAEDWTLTLESSNDDVVMIMTNGYYYKVTAVAEGTAIITAKAGGKQSTCEVTVHVHSYSEGKCTVCGAKLKIEKCEIGDGGVLTKYNGEEANVVIPETVTGIGANAFNGNKNIENVTMEDGVESIGNYAFHECTNLASVTIPASVTSIGGEAFGGCSILREIQFEGTKEQWNAIEGSGNVGIPGIRCSDGHIGVLGIPAYLTVSGTKVTGYRRYGELPANLVIPEGVTSIGSSAFYECMNLKSVTIPTSVEQIGSSAFRGCTSLASVEIPASVTNIKSYVFYGCSKLKSVTMSDGVTSIGGSAFWGCTSLANMTIPASVTSIEDFAFWNCTSLKIVSYNGTKEQWKKISMRESYTGLRGKTIKCTDGDLTVK